MKWIEKYELLLQEELNIGDIRKIIGKGTNKASEIRKEILIDCAKKKIKLPTKQVPTELFLKHIGRDLKYFETKMKQEAKLFKYKNLY